MTSIAIRPAADNPQEWDPQAALSSNTTNNFAQQKSKMQVNSQQDFQPFEKPRISETKQQTLCLQFKRGRCSYGGSCIYSHGVVNKLPLERPKRTMHEMGQWDQKQRMITCKERLCYWYLSGKNCPYGERCHFVHKIENKFNGDLVRTSDGVVLRGKHGDHVGDPKGVLWKTKLCFKWERLGRCLYGATCLFAHGQAELRKFGSLTPLGSGMNACSLNALATLPKNAISRKRAIGSAYEQEEQGKKCLITWNEVEKISQVYADWIDRGSPIEVVSGKVES